MKWHSVLLRFSFKSGNTSLLIAAVSHSLRPARVADGFFCIVRNKNVIYSSFSSCSLISLENVMR